MKFKNCHHILQEANEILKEYQLTKSELDNLRAVASSTPPSPLLKQRIAYLTDVARDLWSRYEKRKEDHGECLTQQMNDPEN